MMISEEIILTEVKAEYTRQLTSWTELNHKSSTFLQLNGLLLSIIVIGLGISSNTTINYAAIWLILSSVSIVISILILARHVISENGVKEIEINVDDDYNLINKEKELMLSLIGRYNIAQNYIINKHKIRIKHLRRSLHALVVGLCFLLASIATVFLQQIL